MGPLKRACLSRVLVTLTLQSEWSKLTKSWEIVAYLHYESYDTSEIMNIGKPFWQNSVLLNILKS